EYQATMVFQKAKRLDKIKKKLLELPITDIFYCFIQYDDINNAMDLVFEKYNSNLELSPQIELYFDLDRTHQNYCKAIMKSWQVLHYYIIVNLAFNLNIFSSIHRLLEWINLPAVSLESHYVYKYVYYPLDTVLDGLLQHFHLYGLKHPAKCIAERKSWYHHPPFGFLPSTFNQAWEYFNDVEDKERNIISEEIIIKGNDTTCL
ncbi:29679_t:CDS:2, partial [Racocetra persica]